MRQTPTNYFPLLPEVDESCGGQILCRHRISLLSDWISMNAPTFLLPP